MPLAEADNDAALGRNVLDPEAGLAPDTVQLPKHPYSSEPEAVGNDHRHIFNQYVLRVPRRDELQAHLQAAGIGCEIYYPVPLHLQECFVDLGYKEGGLPESERAANETLALPIYPELNDEQAKAVVGAIKAFYSG